MSENWEANIGNFARDYFSSFADYLAYEKFESDDLLREGLAEAVPKGVVKFRIVDKLQTDQNGYNEIVLDGDELVIQVRILNDFVCFFLCDDADIVFLDHPEQLWHEHL